MNFQLSPGLDRDKIFFVKWSELEGRLDPSYNRALVKNTIPSKYQKQKIGSLCKSYSGGTPSKADKAFWIGNIPWVSPKDMKSFYLTDTVDHISTQAVGESSTNLVPKNSVLIVVRSGILQHTIPVAIITREMAINQDIKALIFNDTVLPAYPAYFILVHQSKLLPLIVKHSTTVQSINTDQFNALKIPIPPKEIQAQIVAKMDAVYSIKKQKEMEAQRLLDNIDEYLLSELGIVLPQQEENSIQIRIFRRRLSDVSCGRLDPNYHFNIELITGHQANYEFVKLKDIIKDSAQYGANESAVDGTKGSETRYIRITDISEIGELQNNSWKTAETINDQYLLHYNDLLFARSGSVGRAYIHKNITEKSIFAGYLIRFIINEGKADPDYIFFYCHSVMYKMWVKAIFRPAVQANINAEEYKSLLIPLPPIEKQTEIASHITHIRNKAKQLQQQAKMGLEQAKKEVESLILGED